MAKINLLPWRQEQRKEQQRQYFTIMGLMALLVVLLVVLVFFQYTRLIDKQTERNDFLQDEIKKVEDEIKEIEKLKTAKEQLIARMEIIQELQRNRPEIVHLFDEMVRVIPDGIHLISMEQKGNIVGITGIAQSNARVSALMRNIDDSDWLAEPKLVYIESRKGDGEREFVLLARQKSVLEEDSDEDSDDVKPATTAGAGKP